MSAEWFAAPAPKCPTGQTPVCPMCVYASNPTSCTSLHEDCSNLYDVSSPVEHENIEIHL